MNLSSHLKKNGLLYVEVPMEVWGRAPLQSEPVTHLNFFTRSSLIFLLQAAGLEVLNCQLSSSLHPSGQRFAALKAVAICSATATSPTFPGSAEAELFLSERFSDRLLCSLRCPRVLVNRLAHRLVSFAS